MWLNGEFQCELATFGAYEGSDLLYTFFHLTDDHSTRDSTG